MNPYYQELIHYITTNCGLDKNEKVIYSNWYLTFEDYLFAVSRFDTIKSILALLKTFSNGAEVHRFLRETIALIIQNMLSGYEPYIKLYGRRIKRFF